MLGSEQPVSNLPPSGPPGTPPSSPPPPPLPGSAEYLDSGGGRPLGASAPGGPRGGIRKALLVGGGVVGLAAVGVGAWAAVSFMTTGPQPAEALPDGTLAYLSVDLDPSGGQKIEALRTLNKFPAFEDEVGIDTDDDIRKAIFDEIQGELDCPGLDFEDDVEPWLGDRAAVAAVGSGGETPDPVFVLQVKDAEAADKGMKALQECATAEGGDAEGGWSIEGDWAVIAETDEIAESVSEDAAEASLADDEDFQKWVGEAGDSGIVTMYAGPALGDYLAEHTEDLFGFPFGGLGTSLECVASPDGVSGSPDDDCYEGGLDGGTSSMVSDDMKQKLEDFKGMAGVLRFDDGSVELEFATAGDVAGSNLLASNAGGDTISSLPADTAAAIGVGFSQGWFGDLLEIYAPYLGLGGDLDSLIEELEAETGLVLPDDIETLFGDSAALALGSDFDPEVVFESSDGSEVPVALKVDGDPEEIEAVLDKLRDQVPPDEALVFDADAQGDTIVIGPNEDFRKQVLEDGGLGDSSVFQDVVREVDDASVVLFVNLDELQDLVEESLGEFDQDVVDNLEPVSGFGISGYVEDGVAHSVTRLTTD